MGFVHAHTIVPLVEPREEEDPDLPSPLPQISRLRFVRQVLLGLAFILLMIGISAISVPVASSHNLQSKNVADSEELLRLRHQFRIPPLTDDSCPNFSPAFPSAGGPDCTFPCPVGAQTGGLSILNPFPESYFEKIREAGDIINSIDPSNTLYLDGRGDWASHISISYLCCYTEADLQKIKPLLLEEKKWWTPQELNLSYATCAIDGPDLDHVSFIVMLDSQSNERMLKRVTALERKLQKAGFPIHLPRRHQEPFHTTIGVVNGSGYPVRKAVEQINKKFPPGSWLNQDPLQLGNITFILKKG